MNKALWNKNFILVLTGQIVSLFGNAILRFALPLYLLNITGSPALFGLVSACAFIPMIFLAPAGGIIADRLNKRNIMVILDFSAAVLLLLLTVSLNHADPILCIFGALIFLYGIWGAYQPAVQASIPLLVPSESIMRANACINLVTSLSGLIGPVLGGALLAAFDIYPILFASLVCFFLSAVMEIFICIPFQKRKAEGNILKTGFYDLKESLHFMTVDFPLILKISLICTGFNLFLSSCANIGLPVIITQTLGFSAKTANRLYGLCEGVMGAGGLTGGLCAGLFASKLKARKTSALLFFCSLTLVPVAAVLTFPLHKFAACIILLVSVFFMMVTISLFSIQLMTYLQILTPEKLLGKVISCTMCISNCAVPLGQSAYGILFEKFDAMPQLLFFATFVIVSVISFLSVKPFLHVQDILDKMALNADKQ